MKRLLYAILLLAETVIGFLLLNLVWYNYDLTHCLVIVFIWAALLVWQLIMFKKNPAQKRKYLRNIALVMLVPIVLSIALFVWLIVGLMMVI